MTMPLRAPYPEIEPYHTGFLKVSDLHSIYYEEAGNPQGQPIVFLHGGPGGGTGPAQRRFFDPQFYRIILFDQRGCGKSTPFAELLENTTWDLVEDIEKLRRSLGIERWVVFGGSWGSTLALAYATQHPQPVRGLILRGIFLCRSSEVHWFYQDGASHVFPEAWEKYLAPIPLEERGDLVQAYRRRLTHADERVRLEAAVSWSVWEASTTHLFQDQKSIQESAEPQKALPLARIENQYMLNRAYMKSDTYLLEKAAEINHLPCRIVQGRYDMCCPATSAWELTKAMPRADLRLVPDAGHSAMEPGIASELVRATDDFKELYA
jgi:proline iminopeptidase